MYSAGQKYRWLIFQVAGVKCVTFGGTRAKCIWHSDLCCKPFVLTERVLLVRRISLPVFPSAAFRYLLVGGRRRLSSVNSKFDRRIEPFRSSCIQGTGWLRPFLLCNTDQLVASPFQQCSHLPNDSGSFPQFSRFTEGIHTNSEMWSSTCYTVLQVPFFELDQLWSAKESKNKIDWSNKLLSPVTETPLR